LYFAKYKNATDAHGLTRNEARRETTKERPENPVLFNPNGVVSVKHRVGEAYPGYTPA
jgi:hypothetical protein